MVTPTAPMTALCICNHEKLEHLTHVADRTGQEWGVTIVRPVVCAKCDPMNADHGFVTHDGLR